MVALGVAAGALSLILSANGASLRKSLRARQDRQLLSAAESKRAELKLGLERASEGEFAGLPGLRWERRPGREDGVPLPGLKRQVFRVLDADGTLRLSWEELE